MSTRKPSQPNQGNNGQMQQGSGSDKPHQQGDTSTGAGASHHPKGASQK